MAETPRDISTTRKPRWHAPTPAKFLFAVLVMQGVLFLSAHYRWFWFNERKGYTVLITVAATAGALLFLVAAVFVSRFVKAKAKFGLATLLLMVPVMGIPCAWLAREMELANQQRQVMESANNWSTDLYSVSKESWVADALGTAFFCDVTFLGSESFTDADMEHLKVFKHLILLDLGGTEVTDAGLTHLKGLTSIKDLYLAETKISDTGVQHLRGLTNLRTLNLGGTQVTDAGLEYLEGLTQLQVLWLRGTQVTDAGIDQLKIALPNCDVEY